MVSSQGNLVVKQVAPIQRVNTPLAVGKSANAAGVRIFSAKLLGVVAFSYNNKQIDLRNRKAQAILAYLSIGQSGTERRERLADLLWSEANPDHGRSTLRRALVDLRRALRAVGCAVLEFGRTSITLDRTALEVDATVLVEAVQAGDVPDLLLRQPLVSETLLAGLDALDNEFSAWLTTQRLDLHRRLLLGLVAGASAAGSCRAAHRRMAEATMLLEPTHEEACRLLMRFAAEDGDVAGALRIHDTLYRALDGEHDMEPTPATQELLAQIKLGQFDRLAERPPSTPGITFATRARAGPPWIAVMPFRTLGPDPIPGYFAEGLAEGIVHVLSGIGELFVIARGTARAFAGRSVDPREVGREIGVDYVLSGQVVAASEGLRVSTELAETGAGLVIRTGLYEATPHGLFALQDRIAGEVVGVIAPAVKEHALARAKRKPPGTLSAYDLMLQGVELQYALAETSYAQAGERLYEAIARDPGNAPAYAHAATWHNFRIGQGWSRDHAEDGAQAARCAAKALELDPNNALALAIQGQVLSFNGRNYEVARQYLDRAIALGPSSVLAWTLSAATHSWTGNGALGIEHATRALRLSPYDPFVFFTEHMLSQSHYMAGEHDTAIAIARGVAQRNPRLTSNLRTLAASLVATDAIDAAREVAAGLLHHEPNFRLSAFGRRTPLCDAVRGDYITRLRLAGLPD